jgi:uncharacterized protein (DUF924 family)
MRDTKQEIIHFWFVETEPQLWFQKNDVFDARIRDRFFVTYEMARDGLCQSWSVDADGSLALCLVLDQFPRNLFRGLPQAYETDEPALLVSKRAVSKGFDQVLAPEKRRFLYMPFMHSEALSDQKRAVELFQAMRDVEPLSYEYALRHMKVIEQFGRFPHRNAALGRETTPEEQVYLDAGGGF